MRAWKLKGRGGQLQLEAIVCFCAFLALLWIFLAQLNLAGVQAGLGLDSLEAKAGAEKCCVAVDSVFSGNLSGFSDASVSCAAEANIVKKSVGSKSRESGCIASEARVAERGGKSVLEVGLSGHYG